MTRKAFAFVAESFASAELTFLARIMPTGMNTLLAGTRKVAINKKTVLPEIRTASYNICTPFPPRSPSRTVERNVTSVTRVTTSQLSSLHAVAIPHKGSTATTIGNTTTSAEIWIPLTGMLLFCALSTRLRGRASVRSITTTTPLLFLSFRCVVSKTRTPLATSPITCCVQPRLFTAEVARFKMGIRSLMKGKTAISLVLVKRAIF